MQVIIGSTDVTAAVQEKTYKVDSIEKYTAWTNANNVEVHSNRHFKIEGTFDMVFIPDLTMEYSTFKTLLDANTTSDGVTTLSLTVNNLDGELKVINCFVTISFSPMIDLKNGSNIIFKRCTVTVREC